MFVSYGAVTDYHSLRGLTGHTFITPLEVRLEHGSAGLRSFLPEENPFPCPFQLPEVTYIFLFMTPFLHLTI